MRELTIVETNTQELTIVEADSERLAVGRVADTAARLAQDLTQQHPVRGAAVPHSQRLVVTDGRKLLLGGVRAQTPQLPVLVTLELLHDIAK